jgi:predicted alpha/beta-hydrolase family hydrolase
VTTAITPVDTPRGPGRLLIDAAERQSSILVLGHGAGGGPKAADLELLASQLPRLGTTVVRFEQPWRTAGRRAAAPPAQLDEAWLAAIDRLERQPWAADRLFVGGRSAGARVACRTADRIGAAGIVCLAFPLHLPGRPERSRLAELLAPAADRLVLQGTRDAFGSAAEVRAAATGAKGITIVDLPDADHGYRLPKNAGFTAADLRATIIQSVADFVAG